MAATKERDWPVRLFKKSVLKQNKYRKLTAFLGPTEGLHCLDIGADNGVISYLLRRRGGSWKSADLDDQAVASIRDLVHTEVYPIDGEHTPFRDDEFDAVVLVDFLEHIPDDRLFIPEAFRILKPGGLLIANVPHLKDSLLRRFRFAIGQTDEKHGHLRPGYTLESLRRLFGDKFEIEAHATYSKFFSELVDALIVFGVGLLQRSKKQSKKGLIVTGRDLERYSSMFRLYSLVYPLVWLFSKLDGLLFFTSGYFLIVRLRSLKEPATLHVSGNGHTREKLLLAGKD